MTRILLIAALACAFGCNDRTRTVSPTRTGQPDLGVVTDAAFDDPVRNLCVPGSQRCVAENSPLYESCAADGRSFARETCADTQVCRAGECVPFTCVPDRPLCVGATTAATCDASGNTVSDPTECEGSEVCVGGSCIDPCQTARDARSYITCDYRAVELPNYANTVGTASPYAIVVANPATLVPAEVTVRNNSGVAPLYPEVELVPDGSYTNVGRKTTVRSEVINADGTTVPFDIGESIHLGPGAAAVFLVAGSTEYAISSTRPVVAYQFSPYCCNFTATNDASLLLPTSSWSTRYRVVNYPAWRQGDKGAWQQPYVSVVASEPASVTVTAPVEVTDRNGNTGTSLQFDLAAGESKTVFTALGPDDEMGDPGGDISGAVVTSDVPVGAFAGHPCTFIPSDQWACDHLEEALFPADILGSRYILTPTRRRSDRDLDEAQEYDITEATYWRIVADESATLTFDPPLTDSNVLSPSNESTAPCTDGMALEPGDFCEFGATAPVSLNSSGALIVGGFISGHQSTGVRAYGTQAGDPSMFILPPVEQYRTSYAFVSPPTFLRTYVAVAAPRSLPITLDGRAIPEDKRLERRELTLGGQSYEVFTVALEPGVHRMSATSRFGIVVYAYDDYVSYAFTGGLDLVPKGAP